MNNKNDEGCNLFPTNENNNDGEATDAFLFWSYSICSLQGIKSKILFNLNFILWFYDVVM